MIAPPPPWLAYSGGSLRGRPTTLLQPYCHLAVKEAATSACHAMSCHADHFRGATHNMPHHSKPDPERRQDLCQTCTCVGNRGAAIYHLHLQPSTPPHPLQFPYGCLTQILQSLDCPCEILTAGECEHVGAACHHRGLLFHTCHLAPGAMHSCHVTDGPCQLVDRRDDGGVSRQMEDSNLFTFFVFFLI